ncbi:NADH-quinone oxidoreductase subunit J [Tomitella biformata]|uniref:NADH-quinone oxidoreductase subunit J n=1 Tax=Tomitella biformata TaxID=630403 RepID=UPI0004646D0B|nr:NADH-quinone oxidoreductase subunit J [Tomitella biformata]
MIEAAAVQASAGEATLFWVLGTFAVIGALGVVSAAKAVYSALFLAMTMIILAVFYIVQDAVFLGVVQIVVYTGAVMMLFLFVLMLVGLDSSESLVETLRGQRVAAVLVGLGFGALLIGGIGNAVARSQFTGLAEANAGGNVEGLAELIFTRYVWAFEVTGALLITATVGAMVLAHREPLTKRKGQRELSQDRVRGGDRVTTLPTSGVYARHNAVDVPALLPDGTYSSLSVSRAIQTRASGFHTGVNDSTPVPNSHPQPDSNPAGEATR